jgi:hypothetical protein
MLTIDEWVQIAVSIFIGIAALIFAKSANKLTKQANKIAINDKVYKIFNFFNHELGQFTYNEEFFNEKDIFNKIKRMYELEHEASFLFNDDTYLKIEAVCESVISVLLKHKFPEPKVYVLLKPSDTITTEEANGVAFLLKIQTDISIILNDYKLRQ